MPAPDILAPGAAAGGFQAAGSLGHVASLQILMRGSPQSPCAWAQSSAPGARGPYHLPGTSRVGQVRFSPQSGWPGSCVSLVSQQHLSRAW